MKETGDLLLDSTTFFRDRKIDITGRSKVFKNLLPIVNKTGKIDFFINCKAAAQPLLGNSIFDFSVTVNSISMRDIFMKNCGFALWSDKATEVVKSYSNKILGVGSGSAFIENILSKNGIDVIATDKEPLTVWKEPHMDVTSFDAVDAVEAYPDRDVLMSWPSLDLAWSYHCAKTMKPGRFIFYIGEPPGGCVSCDSFFDYVFDDDQFEKIDLVKIPQWYGMHDYLYILRKR